MVRKVLAAACALVAGFHVWLFVSQLGDGRLADVSVLARWGVAAFLVAALWYLRQRQIPVFWGRRAVAVWLLAALLHAPAVTDRLQTSDAIVPEEVAAALMQVSTGAALLTLLVLTAIAFGRAATTSLRRFRLPLRSPPARRLFADASSNSHQFGSVARAMLARQEQSCGSVCGCVSCS
jgi:hypothetical protein